MEKEQISYEICIPPLKKPCCEFNHEEAEAFFQWHMAHIDERISYLRSVLEEENAPRKLDLSPESLMPIWRWFLSVAEIEQTPTDRLEELEALWLSKNIPFTEDWLRRSQQQFSLETEYILRDIGMYLGQVFVLNHPEITWTYYETPKTDFFVNIPLLSGFYDMHFSPPFRMFFVLFYMSGVQAARMFRGAQSENDLFRIYKRWESLHIIKANNDSY